MRFASLLLLAPLAAFAAPKPAMPRPAALADRASTGTGSIDLTPRGFTSYEARGGGMWQNWRGPPACSNSHQVQSCSNQGHDCNKQCQCVPWQGCGEGAKCACEEKGGSLDSSCNCIVPTGTWGHGGGHGHKRGLFCPESQTACLLDPTSSRRAYECVDLAATIDSCGGCIFEGAGQDCTAIEGADEVACVAGSCAVRQCAPGWAVNVNGTACEVVRGRVDGQRVLKGALRTADKFWGF